MYGSGNAVLLAPQQQESRDIYTYIYMHIVSVLSTVSTLHDRKPCRAVWVFICQAAEQKGFYHQAFLVNEVHAVTTAHAYSM